MTEQYNTNVVHTFISGARYINIRIMAVFADLRFVNRIFPNSDAEK